MIIEAEHTVVEHAAVGILRRILAKTEGGPSECFGVDMHDGAVWKSSFAALLDEARVAVEPVG